LKFEQATDSLSRAMEMLRDSPPSVVVVDKAFGIQTILEWLTELRTADPDLSTRTGIVIWGVSVTEAEALRFLQAGARGILRKTATIPMLVACLRSVAAGRTWMEDCVFRDSGRSERYPRSELTAGQHCLEEVPLRVDQFQGVLAGAVGRCVPRGLAADAYLESTAEHLWLGGIPGHERHQHPVHADDLRFDDWILNHHIFPTEGLGRVFDFRSEHSFCFRVAPARYRPGRQNAANGPFAPYLFRYILC
jgi:CheY-like chemotaxis protein